jgi:hypothetical protein
MSRIVRKPLPWPLRLWKKVVDDGVIAEHETIFAWKDAAKKQGRPWEDLDARKHKINA